MSSPATSRFEPAQQPPFRPLRLGLPYGAVMATGGAAQLAGACGLPGATRPLLWLALAEAGWIAGRGLVRHRNDLRLPTSDWAAIGPPSEHTGALTVPLGVAVVATGLSTQPGPARVLGAALVVLAWLSTVVFATRFSVSAARRSVVTAVDGGWFLAPAALLGAGIAAGAYAGQALGLLGEILRWAALLAAGIGLLGYWAVAVIVALAIPRRGLGQGKRVLWWIAAGCGGLAAAAVGRALSAGGPWPAEVVALAHGAAIVTWSFAALLVVPILTASMRFLVVLARDRRIERTAPWPPTFSTAVFALGALGTAKMLDLAAVADVGKVAAAATLALWVATAALHASRLLPSPPRTRRSDVRRARPASDHEPIGAGEPASDHEPISAGEPDSAGAGSAIPLRSGSKLAFGEDPQVDT